MRHAATAPQAVSNASKGYICVEGDESIPHSQSILPVLQSLLTQEGLLWTDIHMFAIGHGPGSFTGVRVACALISGVNATLQRPILPISSLAITACRSDSLDTPIYVLENAYANEAFVGRYLKGEALQKDACLAWDDVAMKFGTDNFVSHYAQTKEMLPSWSSDVFVRDRSEALVIAVNFSLSNDTMDKFVKDIQPVYLQQSQAERNLIL